MFAEPAYPFPKTPDMEALATTISQAADHNNSGLIFSEVMSGFIYAGSDVGDFDVAAKLARGRCESARFVLSTRSWDTNGCECKMNFIYIPGPRETYFHSDT